MATLDSKGIPKMNKNFFFTLFFGLFIMSLLAGQSIATPIYVLQNDVLLGTIQSYKGDLSPQDNHIDNQGFAIGPEEEQFKGNIFIYEDNFNNLSFNYVFDMDTNPNSPGTVVGRANWDITVSSHSDANKLDADEFRELVEDGSMDDLFHANHAWFEGYADAGVIGYLAGDWTVTIEQLNYSNLNGLNAYSADGSNIWLDLNYTKNIVLTSANPSLVPEPASIVLFGIGLLGFLGVKKIKYKP
jgi:hypothetical protein